MQWPPTPGPGVKRMKPNGFVVCRNPDEATRDAAIRERLLGQLEAAIAESDALAPAAREKLACDLRGTPNNRRFLRTTKAGLLRIDRAAVTADVKLDGKFLLRTSDPTLSAEDVATGYKVQAAARGRAGLAGHEDDA